MARQRSLNRPFSVLIGAFTYTILYDKDRIDVVQNDMGALLNGHTDHDKLLISVRPDRPEDAVRETLMHELMHCVTYATGIYFERFEWNDEAFTRRCAPVMSAMFRDNPELAKYLAA